MLEKSPLGVKMILLGEAGVGKTSIIKRFLNNQFDDKEASSLTMNYAGKIIKHFDKEISLDIWDTIGQERFRSLSSLFLNNANIIILVYSIVSNESFEALDYWYNLYKELHGDDIILGVAGNKSDLFLEEEVPEEKGRKYAQDHEAIFGLLSAKEGKATIEQFINNLVKAYLTKNKDLKKENNNNEKIIRLDSNKNIDNGNAGDSGCCSGGKNKAKVKKYESILKQNDGYLFSIFLGDDGVGKTSIIKRLEGKEFSKDEEHTNNINESIIFCKNNTMNIKMKIFDINNAKSKSKKIAEIITKSKIYFLVYDIKSKKGLDNLKYWIGVIKNSKSDKKNKDNYLIIIIGNKNDKSNKNEEENEEVIKEKEEKKYINEGKDLALQNKGIFKITSAMENSGLEDLIKEVVECYLTLP